MTILTAIDLSEYSVEIMKVAMEIAYACEAEVIFINVINQREFEALDTIANKISNVSTEELRHIEGQRYIVGLVEQRIAHAHRSKIKDGK